MNLADWLQAATRRLESIGIDSPKLEAQIIAAHVLLRDRSWLVAHPEAEINELAAETLLQRRECREPLAYILGWREFYGRRFMVTPNVLIPRHETETLVESALRTNVGSPILDLGTGSGCIAITLKQERPEWEVWASDISEAALEVARRNADDLGAKVRFVLSDKFSNLTGSRFAAIVSNPPYIADSEQLMPEVARYEPPGALFAGPTGLEFYEQLGDEAVPHLESGGRLFLEVGYTQAADVVAILRRSGWKDVEMICDLSGISRVVIATSPE